MPIQPLGKNLNAIRKTILLNALTNIEIEQEPVHLGKRLALQDLLSSLIPVASNPSSLAPDAFDHSRGGNSDSVPVLEGGITDLDLRRFNKSDSYDALDTATLRHLEAELDSMILSIAVFLNEEASSESSDAERLVAAEDLPDTIQASRDELVSDQEELSSRYARIRSLVEEVNEIHPSLQESLTHAINSFPASLDEKRSANNNLVAATIEASLIKLSLIRARSYQALYGHTHTVSNKAPACMKDALSAAYGKLKRQEQKMEEEERELDQQLKEYGQLLQLVDGGRVRSANGGFAQVVDDWSRVKKETEECRKDLRRLGWSGD